MTVVGGKAYVFGGAAKDGGMMGDLWRLDLEKEEKAWEKLEPLGRQPHVRCSHAAAAVGDNLFFFGGSFYK
jgi:N-acetylneuraminic acid mutarotase